MSRSRRMLLVLLPIYLSTLGGCRSRGVIPDPQIKPDGSGGGVPGAAKPKGPSQPQTGPKVMGYQYYIRATAGVISGKYSDKQENELTGREREQNDVALKGKRVAIEHYPIIIENYPKSHYGFVMVDVRDEVPDPEFWHKRLTAVGLLGYILPWNRIIAPVVGVHWEFNNVALDHADSPEVATADIRASVVGVHLRRKLWGMGTWLSLFYEANAHLLNFGQPSSGTEIELGLGSAFQFSFLRSDATLSYLDQRYNANRAVEAESEDMLKIKSSYNAFMASVTFWL